MKNLIFICCILIILFKTGNVLSDNNIFNVNNIEISKETYKNKDRLVSKAFQKAFDELINRLLLEEDHKRLSGINLEQIENFSNGLYCFIGGEYNPLLLLHSLLYYIFLY